MPQINRIRVNNVKYNFGTQYYDDFMMRFSCKNTIYDLANGGGKSLLMLLLLQNLIPNCTLDEKQPIEKLFRAGGGNTTIHSLIEWKIDPCYRKDNYKYMTTGFCARKGKGAESDDESTVQNDGVGTEGIGSTGGTQTAVEYFNYVIFYREFGDNDIRNLPLVSGEERITYNGLKNYLKDLEKKDFNVSVKVFDRKGDYQSFISRYGLFESEWEIVRGINKTEGHVRTYFETNYRTSRKVVEDLLIEEIIQKSFNNRLSVDNDEGKMAQTLLDIKDKLVELSKKHSEMSAYDSQVVAMEEFSKYVGTFEEIYIKKERIQKTLYDMLVACKCNNQAHDEKQHKMEAMLERMKFEMSNEQKMIQTAEVLAEQASLDKMIVLIDETSKKKENYLKASEELRTRLLNLESANDYRDYLEYKNAYDETNATINNRLRDHEDIISELKVLALIKYEKDKIGLRSLEDRIAIAKQEELASKSRLEDIKVVERETDRQVAVLDSKAMLIEEEISKDETAIRILMESGLILVAENATQTIDELQDNLVQYRTQIGLDKTSYNEYYDKLEKCKNNINRADVKLELLEAEIQALDITSVRKESDKSRYEGLAKVYNETEIKQLIHIISNTYHTISKDIADIESNKAQLETYCDNLMSGKYTCNGKQYKEVKDYLLCHYGEDVVNGREWYYNLNIGQKRDIMKRVPFIEYGFIIKNDFERIKADTTLQSFTGSSYAVPVISENVIYDTKLEVNTELVTFAMKDLSFIGDETKVEVERKSTREEIDSLQMKLDKLNDRAEVIREDYEFVLVYDGRMKEMKAGDGTNIDTKQADLRHMNEEKNTLIDSKKKMENRCKELTDAIADTNNKMQETEQNIDKLFRIKEVHERLNEKYIVLSKYQQEAKAAAEKCEESRQLLSQAIIDAETTKHTALILLESKDKASGEWDQVYAPYYDKNTVMNTDLSNVPMDELETRFAGLKAVLDKETSDISDKETLMNTYRVSLEKCKKSIEYRGMQLEKVAEDYHSHKIYPCEATELMDLKNKVKSAESDISKYDYELDSQNALMNRLEGSIEHGKYQITEKFGKFETFACDNPSIFVDQHKALSKKLQENLKEMEHKINVFTKQAKDQLVMEKDLERIVKNAGMQIPTVVSKSEVDSVEPDFADYESVQHQFDDLLKLEYKKKDEFRKRKEVLVNLLIGFNASELAREVSTSVNVPDNAEKTRELMASLAETNSFIILEKDRIVKGIEDMERIKNNFENRCIQTCSNIKTELDRLPKLSNIMMDSEIISMIGLQIPYVKEEFFKDRMSSYINETVTGAESFKDPEDRLKYIRNRLTWKRLFSVIVTDMNAIAIKLYKRERIRDQSRYLKYEEAVGSTGQSQGIYIQFLIAIINYISNINASSNETASLGKIIFIDNPFGAAKDIYIWEPIFKLLKTNHVQLIVPARGATPAITGRFDVNYILGQKLVNGRQQTVVVDYHSQVAESQLEYARMDYEQATLNLM